MAKQYFLLSPTLILRLVLFFLFLSGFVAETRAQNFVWAKQLSGIDDQSRVTISGVKADAAGNTYVTGLFTGTVDFDLSPTGITSLTAVNTLFGDIFLVKYNPQGNLIWIKQIKGTGTDLAFPKAMTLQGNYIYLTGVFSSTAIDFDPSGAVASLDPANGATFITRYSTSGALDWIRQTQGQPDDIAVDATENVFLAGHFDGTIDVNPDPVGVANLTSAGQADLFVAKYNAAGVYQWAQRVGGPEEESPPNIGIDGVGNVYLTGGLDGTVSFIAPSTTTLVSTRQFLAKYDGSTGTLQWVDGLMPNIWSLLVDGSGNSYLTGDFSNTVDFDPSANTINRTSAGQSDIYLAHYNTNGGFVSVQTFGGIGAEGGTSLVQDASGNLYLTGYFSNTVDFNPSGSSISLTAINTPSIFVAKYDAAGAGQWAVNTNLTQSGDFFSTLALSGNNSVFVAGGFSGSGDVDPSANTAILSTTASSDVFLAHYGECIGITAQPVAGSVVNTGSTVTATVSTSGGVASYQWYQNGTAVVGQTSATLSLSNVQPTDAGNYSLVVTGACASVTSTAFNLTVVAPTVTAFVVNPNLICAGSVVTFTATVGNVSGTYDFTLTNGTSSTTGSTTATPFSQSWTAAGFGVQTFTLTVSANGSFTTAVTSLTVGGVGSSTAINYWSGCVSTDWQTAGNWSKGHVPTASEDVVILVTATNQPVLNGAGTANSVELPANTTLTIGGSGTLTISGVRSIGGISTGFHNSGRVDNSGRLLLIESTPLTNTQAIRNHNLFNNLTGASIVIDRSGSTAFGNASGASFVNSGSLTMGATVGGSEGFFNNASATNSGYISIDRTSSRGFFNTTGSSFVNSGTLVIGSITSGASQGIQNQTSFINLAGGLIKIDGGGVTALGIANTAGSIVNSGTISIGSTATAGQDGIGNGASFTNTAGGLITIDRVSFSGLANSRNFVNSGTITIGTSGSVGYYSLFNASSGSGSFNNLPCGVLNVQQAVYNSITLVNQGLMVVSTTATHSNTTDITNQGVISYLLGNPIPNVTNAGIIALPITLCGQSPYSPVLEISGSNTLTVGSTWFTNAQQTNVAGSYSSNTFSPNLPGGTTSTLWFTVTDAANSCGLSVPLSVTVKATPSLTVTAAPSLTITEGNSVTLTASGADSYIWTGGGTGASLTATPASTSVYSVTGTNATSGCTSVTSVTVTVNAIGCNAIIYVTESGTGLQDGSSWANALPGTSLQLAIDRASACGGNRQVWVARGMYKPTTTTGPDSRTISFSMRNNVAIYGGFLGSETALSGRSAVNPVTGQPSSSTLSGELGNPNSLTDNSYSIVHHVEGLNLTNSARLDGFVITRGSGGPGGGMWNETGNSPTLQNCLFIANLGGGMYNEDSSPTLTDCAFQSNTASGGGGGIYNQSGSNPILTNCIFERNEASHGGGVWSFDNCNATLTNCTFRYNQVLGLGGGLYTQSSSSATVTNCVFLSNSAENGGGGMATIQSSTVTITACTFQSNTAPYGGGMQHEDTDLTLRNCLFRANVAFNGGGGVYAYNATLLAINTSFEQNSTQDYGGAISAGGSTTLINCSFQGNSANSNGIYGAIIQSGATFINCVEFGNGTGKAFTDDITASYSLFAPSSYTEVTISGTNNLTAGTPAATVSPFASTTSTQLAPCSPAINAGDPATTSATVGNTDLAGNSRFFNGGRIDMGAYEFQGVGIPLSFSVLGSGTATCGASPTITLSGSETGVSYQLRRDGVNTGAARPGTGLALSFGPQSLSGTYTVLATSISGCTALMGTSATVVSNTSSPALSLTPTSATLTCNSPTVSLSAIGNGTVRWSTGESTTVISVSAAGTYTVSLTATNGCTATASAIISGTVLRAATVTTDGPVGCGRTSAQITIQAVGATSFTLLGAGGYSVTNTSGVFSVSAGGSYTGLAGQSGGCVLTGEVTVGSGGIPPSAIDFRASGVLGAGSCTVRLIGTGTGNAFVMTGPGVDSPNGYVFSNVYRNAGTYPIDGRDVRQPGTYTLTVYSGSCSATYTTVVTGTACSSGQ